MNVAHHPQITFTDKCPPHEAVTDFTDQWAEVMDPDHERGEVATALFSVTEETVWRETHPDNPVSGGRYIETTCHFEGLRVEDMGAIRYVDRDEVIAVFGADTIADAEEYAADFAARVRRC